MQSILEQTVKTLHEANEQVEAERQYTNPRRPAPALRRTRSATSVLSKLSATPISSNGGRVTSGAGTASTGPRPLLPVQTRLSYYASSKRARAILGQRRSTIDLRGTIHDGGILLVSTSQGTVGRDVAALVGASMLNLVDAVIREQGSSCP